MKLGQLFLVMSSDYKLACAHVLFENIDELASEASMRTSMQREKEK